MGRAARRCSGSKRGVGRGPVRPPFTLPVPCGRPADLRRRDHHIRTHGRFRAPAPPPRAPPPARRPALACRYRCGDACSRPAPNPTDHTPFREVAGAALNRRRILQAGLVAGMTGTLAACGVGGSASPAPAPGGAPAPLPSPFGFAAVAPNTQDAVVVPDGFAQQVVIRWGDPVLPGAPAFDPDAQTAAAQASSSGSTTTSSPCSTYPAPRGGPCSSPTTSTRPSRS